MVDSPVTILVVSGAYAIVEFQEKSLALHVVLKVFSRIRCSKVFRGLAYISIHLGAYTRGLKKPEKSRYKEKVRRC